MLDQPRYLRYERALNAQDIRYGRIVRMNADQTVTVDLAVSGTYLGSGTPMLERVMMPANYSPKAGDYVSVQWVGPRPLMLAPLNSSLNPITQTAVQTISPDQIGEGVITSSHIASGGISGDLVQGGTLNGALVNIINVQAANIVGTISAGQIASINANQITGQLTSAQIASVSAPQITGQLTASQIGAVNASVITGTISGGAVTVLGPLPWVASSGAKWGSMAVLDDATHPLAYLAYNGYYQGGSFRSYGSDTNFSYLWLDGAGMHFNAAPSGNSPSYTSNLWSVDGSGNTVQTGSLTCNGLTLGGSGTQALTGVILGSYTGSTYSASAATAYTQSVAFSQALPTTPSLSATVTGGMTTAGWANIDFINVSATGFTIQMIYGTAQTGQAVCSYSAWT